MSPATRTFVEHVAKHLPPRLEAVLLNSIDGLARWLGPWMGLVPHQQVSTKAAAEEAKKARNRYHHAG
jgi:hypothetical protein